MSTCCFQNSYWVPCLNITDRQAVVLGKFNDGKNAIAVKRFDNWTSVLCAAPGGLDAGLLNNIAAASGVYTVSSPGLYSEVNDFFMSLHGCRSGKYTIRLPRKVKCVRDAWSGRGIGRNCSETVLDIIAGKSVWLLLE